MVKKGFILVLLLGLAVFAVLAQEGDYARYYMIGYMEGYNYYYSYSSINNAAVRATNQYFGPTTPENRDNKSAFKNGFIDGLSDKAAKRPNKYTTPSSN